jgi:hypothetical protein
MRTLVTFVAATLLCSGLVRAQSTKTWTGVLVAASCDARSADRISDVTAAKKASAHETNTTYEEGVNQSDRNAVSSSAATANPPATAASADNCYALRLPDGRVLRFDDDGNAKIRHRVQSKPMKTVRIEVKGKMQGDTIKVDSIHI